MSMIRRRTSTSSLWVLGILALTACQDGADPATPLDDLPLTEAVLDQTADQLDIDQESMFSASDRTLQRDQRDRPSLDRARLAVDFAGSAVDLSTEILRDAGADDRQLALLGQAEAHLRQAVAALDAGNGAEAKRRAHAASWTALKAWVLPDGVSDEEIRMVQTTAETLLTEATAAVGGDDGLPGQVLSWATTFYDRGVEKIAGGQPRGVAALWKSAILSHWLVN